MNLAPVPAFLLASCCGRCVNSSGSISVKNVPCAPKWFDSRVSFTLTPNGDAFRRNLLMYMSKANLQIALTLVVAGHL